MKITTATRIRIGMENEAPLETKKILMIGLDNSGKTSILLSLKGDRNLMSYFSLKPTQGVTYEECTDAQTRYYCWDLGGQTQYRHRHLENFTKYLEDVAKVIYVFDVQDVDRYDEALKYLRDIAKKGGEKLAKLPFIIYLHKYDPVLENDFKNPIHEKIAKLMTQIKELLPRPSVGIFKTSIYTVFRKIAT